MRIKKHRNRNQYLLTEDGIWVRNMTLSNTPSVDINGLTSPSDYRSLLHNELQNSKRGYQQIDSENIFHRKVLIVGDGHDFSTVHRICSKLPSDVAILAVNSALARWELVGDGCPTAQKRSITYFVVNNPYEECMSLLPKKNRYYPKCIASVRTNPDFLEAYAAKRGTIYRYQPTYDEGFCGVSHNSMWSVDDYRNPVCAALSIAYHFDAEQIAMLACDDSFSDHRPGCVTLENGMHIYPQHRIAHGIIDGMVHWIKQRKDIEVTVVDASAGPKYQNAEYITPDSLGEYFKG